MNDEQNEPESHLSPAVGIMNGILITLTACLSVAVLILLFGE